MSRCEAQLGTMRPLQDFHTGGLYGPPRVT